MLKVKLSARLTALALSAFTGFLLTAAAYRLPEAPPAAQGKPDLPELSLAQASDTELTGAGMPFALKTEKAAPKPPKVPKQPAGAAKAQAKAQLKVIGVLPPDVAILSRGGRNITAFSGQSTEYGYLGAVSWEGAYVGGKFIRLSREVVK